MNIKNIINKIELKLIREALPLDTAKKYVSIERNPAIKKQIDDIFNKLKPKAKFKSKRGDRLYIPMNEEYEDIRQDDSGWLAQHIEALLKYYNYKLVNYTKGLAEDKYGRKIKIGKALIKIKKEYEKVGKDNSAKKVVELLDEFNTDPTRDGSKLTNLFIIISKHPYDIAGMTTDRGWKSCMNVISGSNRHYVSCDIEEGTLIAYLIKEDDKNIENPIARILIKPFVKIDDKEEVLYVPEEEVYGSAPTSFRRKIVEIFEDIQNEKFGNFELKGNLYPDSKSSVFKTTKAFNDIFNGKRKPETVNEVKSVLDILGIKKYTINDDLTVDVRGMVDIENKDLKVIPVQFGVVTGSFVCSDNNLTSLEGSPKKVGRTFACDRNNLSSLEGCPQEVGRHFLCFFCGLDDLKGAPEEIGGSFTCSENEMKSLEGAPRKVGATFYCHDNALTSLEGAPEEVLRDFHCAYNKKQFTIEDVKKVTDVGRNIYV